MLFPPLHKCNSIPKFESFMLLQTVNVQSFQAVTISCFFKLRDSTKAIFMANLLAPAITVWSDAFQFQRCVGPTKTVPHSGRCSLG